MIHLDVAEEDGHEEGASMGETSLDGDALLRLPGQVPHEDQHEALPPPPTYEDSAADFGVDEEQLAFLPANPMEGQDELYDANAAGAEWDNGDASMAAPYSGGDDDAGINTLMDILETHGHHDVSTTDL
jgi:hypothetical protein